MTDNSQSDKEQRITDGLRIGGHQWVEANDLVKWPHCAVCGIIRRHDDKNKPCKGAAKIALRNYYTEGSAPRPSLAAPNRVAYTESGLAYDTKNAMQTIASSSAPPSPLAATRDDVLEEAAKVVEMNAVNTNALGWPKALTPLHEKYHGKDAVAATYAAAIRALKGNAAPTERTPK